MKLWLEALQHLHKWWQRYSVWAKGNQQKELKELPVWYLFLMFALSTFGVTILMPKLAPATIQLLELKEWPWQVWLLSMVVVMYWVYLLLGLVVSQAHGRALGERLFGPRKRASKRSPEEAKRIP